MKYGYFNSLQKIFLVIMWWVKVSIRFQFWCCYEECYGHGLALVQHLEPCEMVHVFVFFAFGGLYFDMLIHNITWLEISKKCCSLVFSCFTGC